MKRFLKNLFKHPGTWVLGSIVLVGVAIAVPPAAPALLIAAAVGTGAAGVASAPYFWLGLKKHLFYQWKFNLGWIKHQLSIWITKHPLQAIVVGLALALFITALVLTIGFFTGGVGFAFMAPLFAAGTAAAVGGVSLPAILATAFVIAPLTLGNNLKRFLGWLDSFKYDAVAVMDKDAFPIKKVHIGKHQDDYGNDVDSADEDQYEDGTTVQQGWANERYAKANLLIKDSPLNYFGAVISGMKATVLNKCSSPDAEKLDPPKVKHL